jgi:hypothetical protein
MLNDELKTKVGTLVDDSMKSPRCKQQEREELERLTKEFLRKKGKVIELAPSTERAESLRF